MESYKLLVLGSGGVGKSAMTIQLVQGRFVSTYDPTIEDSYKKKLIVDGNDIYLDILDTAGQDDFASIRQTYMRTGDGFIIVFAVNDSSSFDQVEQFENDIKVSGGKDDAPIVVCGNKYDLENRAISKEDAQAYCSSHKLTYFETSALNNMNISEAFTEVVRQMRAKNPNVKQQASAKEDKENESGGCCNVA